MSWRCEALDSFIISVMYEQRRANDARASTSAFVEALHCTIGNTWVARPPEHAAGPWGVDSRGSLIDPGVVDAKPAAAVDVGTWRSDCGVRSQVRYGRVGVQPVRCPQHQSTPRRGVLLASVERHFDE